MGNGMNAKLAMDNMIPMFVGRQNMHENNSLNVSCLLDIQSLNFPIMLNGPLKYTNATDIP